MKHYTIPFRAVTAEQRNVVGEKNFSIGELINHLSPLGINVPDGFAITADAYVDFLQANSLFPQLEFALNQINRTTFENVAEISLRCRELITRGSFPLPLEMQIRQAFANLAPATGTNLSVAVRSSGTTRFGDLPDFKGQYDTFLNVHSEDQLMVAVKSCYASMFNERALRSRVDEGGSDLLSGISVGVQCMVHSDKGSAGIAFTFEGDSQNENLIYVAGAWGLGQGDLHGRVTSDEFYLSKSALRQGNPFTVLNVRGLKEEMLISGSLQLTEWVRTPNDQQHRLVLNDSDLELLGLWCLAIEKYYGEPIDIEWAKDGLDGKLYILQARTKRHSGIRSTTTPKPIGEKSAVAATSTHDLSVDYHLDELDALHKESNRWLQQIMFMKDEMIFMQKLLESVLHLSLSSVHANHLAVELRQLYNLHIADLYHQIIEHEQWLGDLLQTDTIGRQVTYRTIHSELRIKIASYYQIFLKMRHDVLLLANNYIKENVRP